MNIDCDVCTVFTYTEKLLAVKMNAHMSNEAITMSKQSDTCVTQTKDYFMCSYASKQLVLGIL